MFKASYAEALTTTLAEMESIMKTKLIVAAAIATAFALPVFAQAPAASAVKADAKVTHAEKAEHKHEKKVAAKAEHAHDAAVKHATTASEAK